jgi:hypothetical protein
VSADRSIGHRTSAAGRPGESGVQVALEVVAWAIGLVVALYVLGVIVTWVRLAAARLPVDIATTVLTTVQLFGTGLRSAVLTALALIVLSALAYVLSSFRWEVNGQDWHDIVNQGVAKAHADTAARAARGRRQKHWKTTAPRGLARYLRPVRAHPRIHNPAALGDGAVRVIAGFNILILAGLLSLAVARLFQAILPDAWLASVGSSAFLVAWAVLFIAFHQVLTRVDLLRWGPTFHRVPWVIVVVGALLASAPIGVIVLTGVAISTFGRTVARNVSMPRSAHDVIHSPLPWLLFAIVMLLSLAFNAIPPVEFPRAEVVTSTDRFIGGYLNRGTNGAYFVTCTALADATSANERVRFVNASDLKKVSVGGPSFSVDSGERPSLVSLGLSALSVNGTVKPLFNADLRPQRGTCGGAEFTRLTAAFEDPSLGAGVLVHSPDVPVVQAHDGELPIQLQQQPRVPAPIVALARRYQPTLLVTVADRFWPVSVDALLADRGPHGGTSCLIRQKVKSICGTALSAQDLAGQGDKSDYLQFPVKMTDDSDGIGQFKAFDLGQYVNPGPLHSWLADPGRLDPWYTAQIYFFLGPTVTFKAFPNPAGTPDPTGQQRFIPLEYWFYYPYNYFPLLANSELMNDAPIAGDKLNVDLHQGDWEHIDVLLNATTLTPEWLYMARHSNEGQFIQWGSPSLALDAGHPLVQAAFGGHPTYQPGCGPRIRNQPAYVLVDWLVCGSGRFAFQAATTPLVDIAWQPWRCWRGHFGAAGTRDEILNFGQEQKQGESILDQARGQVYVAGPQAPATQAENKTGGCAGKPGALERAVMAQYFTRREPPIKRRG